MKKVNIFSQALSFATIFFLASLVFPNSGFSQATATFTPMPTSTIVSKTVSDVTRPGTVASAGDTIIYTIKLANPYPAPVTCTDDFNTGETIGQTPVGWTSPLGSCGVGCGIIADPTGAGYGNIFQLVATTAGDEACFSTNNCAATVGDGSLSALVYFPSAAGRAELLWRQNGANDYQASIGFSGYSLQNYEIHTVINGAYTNLGGADCGVTLVGGQIAPTFTANQWVTVSIQVQEFSINMFVNGIRVANTTDTTQTYLAGAAGLEASFGGTAYFSGVTVLSSSVTMFGNLVDTLPTGVNFLAPGGPFSLATPPPGNPNELIFPVTGFGGAVKKTEQIEAVISGCNSSIVNVASFDVATPYAGVENSAPVTLTMNCPPTDTPTVVGGASTATFTNSPTYTSTNTATSTATNTMTNTATQTTTNTVTQTLTNTATNTSTKTATSTASNTATLTPAVSSTFTNTPTDTSAITSTFTNTATNTPAITSTFTQTPTNTMTNTATNTVASASTNTATNTVTNTVTNTITGTLPPSNTFTNTATSTLTATVTNSATQTPTATPPTALVTQGPAPPSSSTQLQGAQNVPVLQVVISNPSGSPITTTGLTLTDSGTGSANDLEGATLVKNGTNLSTTTFSGPTGIFSFSDPIPASSSVTYLITANFSAAALGTYTLALTGAAGTNGQVVAYSGLPITEATVTEAQATSTTTMTSTNTVTNTPVFTSTPTMTSTNTFTNSPTNTYTPPPTSTATNSPTITATYTVTPPLEAIISQPYPNPSNGSTIYFNVQVLSTSTVTMDVFTLAFRKIASQTKTMNGSEPLLWDLKDMKGNPVADGLYYVRIRVTGAQPNTKILKVLILR